MVDYFGVGDEGCIEGVYIMLDMVVLVCVRLVVVECSWDVGVCVMMVVVVFWDYGVDDVFIELCEVVIIFMGYDGYENGEGGCGVLMVDVLVGIYLFEYGNYYVE